MAFYSRHNIDLLLFVYKYEERKLNQLNSDIAEEVNQIILLNIINVLEISHE